MFCNLKIHLIYLYFNIYTTKALGEQQQKKIKEIYKIK